MLAILTIGAKLDLSLALIVMSGQQLKVFWEAVEGDTSLQEKLSASTDGEIDTPIEAAAVVAIAKDAGFIITVSDLLRADAQAILELNDEELEKVAGGDSLGARIGWGAYCVAVGVLGGSCDRYQDRNIFKR